MGLRTMCTLQKNYCYLQHDSYLVRNSLTLHSSTPLYVPILFATKGDRVRDNRRHTLSLSNVLEACEPVPIFPKFR